MRAAALTATLVAAAGSIGFVCLEGQRTPWALLWFFVIWVISPFAGLALASRLSARLSPPVRVALYAVMLVIALGSLAVYGANRMWPRTAQPAFVFVVVPPASWLLAAVVVAIAAWMSARRGRTTVDKAW